MWHLPANCSLKSVCTFKNKNAEESFKVLLAYSAVKVVVKRHFKDAQEIARCFSSFIHQSKK